MQRNKFLLYPLSFFGLLLLLLLLSSRSQKPFLLSFINHSFLLGLFLFLIGSIILIITWGTFDLLVKAFSLIGRNLSTHEHQLYHMEEGDPEERRRERREGNIRLGFFLLVEGVLLIALSFLLLPYL